MITGWCEDALAGAVASGRLTPVGAERLAAFQRPGGALRLTPRSGETDGFFMALLRREA